MHFVRCECTVWGACPLEVTVYKGGWKIVYSPEPHGGHARFLQGGRPSKCVSLEFLLHMLCVWGEQPS